jgi:alkanesulfonate monooxygenase SsuD/methylene tetrahydromethanopterin reductase-like flavin-dependent oxidoreductase (luciferase family)
MTWSDGVTFGMSLPHRSAEPTAAAVVAQVARTAEHLGFQDLWVTNNTLDAADSLDAVTTLSFAAALTTTIRVGVSVLALPIFHPVHVAHQIATLDRLSQGRAILGVGLGKAEDYPTFDVPTELRVRRLIEAVALIKELWAGPHVTYAGQVFQVDDVSIGTTPTQSPHPPIWMGGAHPGAIRRAATLSDGWMGGGGSSNISFKQNVPLLRAALQEAGRDATHFPISKRVFLSVHEDPRTARLELDQWFSGVYGYPSGTDEAGVYGTPAQVEEQLAALVAMGANHLLLNPTTRYLEQTEVLAEVVALRQDR